MAVSAASAEAHRATINKDMVACAAHDVEAAIREGFGTGLPLRGQCLSQRCCWFMALKPENLGAWTAEIPRQFWITPRCEQANKVAVIIDGLSAHGQGSPIISITPKRNRTIRAAVCNREVSHALQPFLVGRWNIQPNCIAV